MSLVDELKEQLLSKPDAIILSVGGGGLLCGIIQGLIQNSWDDIPIVAVETKGAASFRAVIESGRWIGIPKVESIAKTLSVKKVARMAHELAASYPLHSHLVSDAMAVSALMKFADDYKVLVEPSCGAALSPVYENDPILKDYKNIVVIACGGSGVSIDLIDHWKNELNLL